MSTVRHVLVAWHAHALIAHYSSSCLPPTSCLTLASVYFLFSVLVSQHPDKRHPVQDVWASSEEILCWARDVWICATNFRQDCHSVSFRVIFKQGAYNYLSFLAEKLLTFQSTSCWEIPYWPKAFQVLLYKQRLSAHSLITLVAFYACALIVHAHFRYFAIRAERPVVIMLLETLHHPSA